MNAAEVEMTAGASLAMFAGWLGAAAHIMIDLLGVPMPVVIAAIAGTLLARWYLPALTFGSALGRGALWVVVACVCSQGVGWVVGTMFTNPLPTGALGFIALLTSLLGPKLIPVLVEQSPVLLGRWLNRLGPRGENQSGGHDDSAPK